MQRSALFVLLSAFAACHTPNMTPDFATNDLFYVDVPFATKVPGDRELLLLPVADARGELLLPTDERGFPIAYGGDDFWERPVAEMLADVLQRQFEGSGLFTRVHGVPNDHSLVCRPTLRAFTLGATEGISGSHSFADVALQLQVWGPVGEHGKRPLLHDQVYRNRQVTPQELKPASPFRLVGRALQMTMQKTLQGLDGSNIARSQVPVDPTAAVEASVAATVEASIDGAGAASSPKR
jgi:hypothetical protein